MNTHPDIHIELTAQRQAELRSQYGHRRRPSRTTQTTPFDEIGPLVRAARAGDQQAWELLVARLTPTLRGVVRGYGLSAADTEDVLQSTWAAAFMHIDRVREPDAFGGWLTVTARHASLRVIKRATREVLIEDDQVLDVATQIAPESDLVEAEERKALHVALDRLPHRQRTLVRAMLGPSDTSYADLADKLGMPVGSIGPTRERALARLRRDRQLRAAL